MNNPPDVILSIEHIQSFRSEIANNEGSYNASKHACLLSEKVHAHLDRQFLSIEGNNRELLKAHLIKNTLAKGLPSVKHSDVLDALEAMDLSPAIFIAPEAELPLTPYKKPFWLCLLAILFWFWIAFWIKATPTEYPPIQAPEPIPHFSWTEPLPQKTWFSYKNINVFELMRYIQKERNGLMGDPEYVFQVLNLSKLYDMDPILLFAILGQEQNFVPKSHPKAHLMVNNPFNVYNSWEVFNTSLEESTLIAIRTIQNRMLSLPKDEDPFLWLNQIYAEDPNWHVGVRLFYNFLSIKCSLD